MKIQVKQSTLVDILNYLYVDGLFPFSVITIKNGNLISSQSEKDDFVYRYVSFDKQCFTSISQEQETIKIDVEKVKRFAQVRGPDDIITLEYNPDKMDNKLIISDKDGMDKIALITVDDNEKDVSIPFKIKDNVPYLNNGEVPLDTHLVVGLNAFKKLSTFSSIHGTDFYRFKINKNDRKFNVLVGDIHEIEDSSIRYPTCKVYSVNEDLDVIFTKGLKEITKVFTSDVHMNLRSNMPGWFKEITKEHKFGVMITPYIKKD